MEKIRVRLASASYDIHIGPGLLAKSAHLLKENGFTGKLVIITSPVVNHLYGEALQQSLTQEGFTVTTLLVPDGEEHKSLEAAGRLYTELTEARAERLTPILALGGGVIGDLSGFVAATYLRGVPLIHLPTTLLAQVDSSIGGKTAVNHGQLKNMVGAFYQPKLVISDISTLKTLPPEEFVNGLAEVIKYAVISDKGFFAYLEEHLDRIKSRDEAVLEETVFRSSWAKAEVVGKDEKDLGLRNILNYGHTIGHAIESVSDYKIEHGKAVALGMIAAGIISNKLDFLAKAELNRLKSLIRKAGLPAAFPDLEIERVSQAMEHDKKVLKGRVRFILAKAPGDVFITDEVSLAVVKEALVSWHGET